MSLLFCSGKTVPGFENRALKKKKKRAERRRNDDQISKFRKLSGIINIGSEGPGQEGF